MKRTIVIGLCLLVLASTGFAMDKAVGGGLLFGKTFSSGQAKDSDSGTTTDWKMDRTSFGGFAFFGLSQYLEFNLGLLYKSIGSITVGSQTVSGSEVEDMGIKSTTAIQVGIYGKYPFVLSDKLVLFPTAGIDYEHTLGGNNSDVEDGWKWWSDLWIRGGVGADFFFTNALFLRGHLIYGASIPVGGDKATNDYLGHKVGHGLLVKVGLGFMF